MSFVDSRIDRSTSFEFLRGGDRPLVAFSLQIVARTASSALNRNTRVPQPASDQRLPPTHFNEGSGPIGLEDHPPENVDKKIRNMRARYVNK